MNGRTTLMCAALLAAVAAPLAAQTCVGMPSFAAAPMRADFGVSFPTGGTGLSAGLAFGQPAGLFGGVSIGAVNPDGPGGSAKTIGAHGGMSITPRTNPKVGFCPLVSLDYVWNGDLNTTTVGLGGSVGGIFSQGPTTTIVPTAGLSIRIPSGDGTTDTYANLRLGTGFLFKRNTIAVQPLIDVPLGLEGADATFGFVVGFTFGSR